mmetsp:Transcript_744/g.874  ORF Transcript_744/g.874 Transcript_744/m.874 type:complete len:83 (+) Transcript_744:437-685(+)
MYAIISNNSASNIECTRVEALKVTSSENLYPKIAEISKRRKMLPGLAVAAINILMLGPIDANSMKQFLSGCSAPNFSSTSCY